MRNHDKALLTHLHRLLRRTEDHHLVRQLYDDESTPPTRYPRTELPPFSLDPKYEHRCSRRVLQQEPEIVL